MKMAVSPTGVEFTMKGKSQFVPVAATRSRTGLLPTHAQDVEKPVSIAAIAL